MVLYVASKQHGGRQRYRDRIRTEVLQRSDAWDARAQCAARRFLSAVCFRETAESTLRTTGSALLPPIAFYYAIFHGVIGTLYLECDTEPRRLTRASHRRVAASLTDNLVGPGHVDSSVADLLRRLRAFREYANYTVGGKFAGDKQYLRAVDDCGRLYDGTGEAMASLLRFVRAVSDVPMTSPSICDRIRVTIGDHIGDDVYQMYLSQADEDRVKSVPGWRETHHLKPLARNPRGLEPAVPQHYISD